MSPCCSGNLMGEFDELLNGVKKKKKKNLADKLLIENG